MPVGNGTGPQVRDLVEHDGRLVVAGWFQNFNGQSIRNVVSWDGDVDYQSLAPDFQLPGSSVNDLELYGGDLIIAGRIYPGTTAIYRWNGANCLPLGAPFDNGTECLAVYNGELIAGGGFLLNGSDSVNRVARWDGTGWVQMGDGFNETVRDLVVHQGELYAAGVFTASGNGGTPLLRLAKWNGAGWEQVGAGLNGTVVDLFSRSNELLIGGWFTQNGDSSVAMDQIASFDGATTTELADGLVGDLFRRFVHLPEIGLGVGADDQFALLEQDTLRSYRLDGIRCAAQFQGRTFVGGSFYQFGCEEMRCIGELVPGTTAYAFRAGEHAYHLTPSNMIGDDPDWDEPLDEVIGPGRTTIVAHSLSVMARSPDSMFVMPAERNYGFDRSFAGPWADTTGQVDPCDRYQRMFHMDLGMIWDHAANWSDPGYEMHQEIKDWPGNGDLTLGEPLRLAPFNDSDQDGLYEPENGEHPLIKGERATYNIFNDSRIAGHCSGCQVPMLDVHQMTYGHHPSSDPVLTNSVIVNYRMVNRSNRHYDSLYVGFMDFWDLGTDYDHSIGCDTLLEMGFLYNLDDHDPVYQGHPPVQALVGLNAPLQAFLLMNDDYPHTYPYGQDQFANYMWGRFPWGQPVIHPITQDTTRYMYSGDPVAGTGWNVDPALYPISSQNAFMTFGPFLDIAPGGAVCFDLGLVFAHDTLGDHLASLTLAKQYVQGLHNWYQSHDEGCEGYPVVGVQPIGALAKERILVYPDPGLDEVTVSLPEGRGTLRLFRSDGVLMRTWPLIPHQVMHTLYLGDIAPGTYVFDALVGDDRLRARWVRAPR